MINKKRALITGITGQDGSFLAEFLLEKGYEVHGIVRRASTFNRERIEHLFEKGYYLADSDKKHFYLHYGDLTDASSIENILKKVIPDEIYNLGAQSHVRVSFDIPENTTNVVALGTLRLLEGIRKICPNARYYQASSSEMFGNTKEIPQTEETAFYPRSPYGRAKVFAYWETIGYRESWGLHASNGILFNHESERRGETFVTRKITRSLSRIKLGLQKKMYLGNLNAERDWGHAKDFVEAMWLILQKDKPGDYVIGTGEKHSVRDFLEETARCLNLNIKSNGEEGVNEKYVDENGNVIVDIDPVHFRPTDVEILLADFEKAKRELNWEPKIKFKELVKLMVESDLKLAQNEKYLEEKNNSDLLTLDSKEKDSKNIPWIEPYLSNLEEEYLVKAIRSGWISQGSFVDDFEKNFAKSLEVGNCLTVSNGTTALTLALLSLGIGRGDEVIIPNYTFVATRNTVLQVEAEPVLVDIHPQTWCIDVESIKRAITPKTKAIIPVHIYGNVCEMDKIMEIARENNLYVIEDNAESPFSKYNGKYAGTFGDIGCFSFHAAKTITMGEGGAVVTNNLELVKKMRKIKDQGVGDKRYWHDVVGFNFRITNMQAAIGCAQLEKLEEIITNKKRIYSRYIENLKSIKGITFQEIPSNISPLIWAIAIKIDPDSFIGDRDSIIQILDEKRIGTRPGFYPLSVMPPYTLCHNPVSEQIFKNIILLPSSTSLTNEQVDYVCEEIKKLKIPSISSFQ